MQFFTLFKTVVSLIPTLVTAIAAIEQAMPATGKGSDKLAVVKEALSATHEAANDILVPFATLWPMIEKIVAPLVKLITK